MAKFLGPVDNRSAEEILDLERLNGDYAYLTIVRKSTKRDKAGSKEQGAKCLVRATGGRP